MMQHPKKQTKLLTGFHQHLAPGCNIHGVKRITGDYKLGLHHFEGSCGLENFLNGGQYESEFSVFLSIYFVNSFYMKEEPGAHSPQI